VARQGHDLGVHFMKHYVLASPGGNDDGSGIRWQPLGKNACERLRGDQSNERDSLDRERDMTS
jgi:hypothetical protein